MAKTKIFISSVQTEYKKVMLFKDRLEVSNPGSIPLGWPIEKLKLSNILVRKGPKLGGYWEIVFD